MKKVTLVARKMLRYGTRALRAGDAFNATRQDARVLTAVGLAAEAPRQKLTVRTLSPPPARERPVRAAPVVQSDDTDGPDAPDLDALRAEYEALTGKKSHHRWGLVRLKGEVAAAKSQAAAEADAE